MQQQWFGPYLISEEIARGGQGAVFKAIHTQLGTPVAIKILLEPEDARTIKRFRQEAQVLARLRHPNIIQVVDLGEQNGYPYLAMEYIHGMDLKNLLKQGYPAAKAMKDLITIAETLDYCHQQGIAHRDLKPANIVIENETGRPVLIDFGLVKRDAAKMGLASIDQSRLSVTGEVKGTPQFMAPEQLDREFGVEGPLSDVYALGGILYFILTGVPPIQGATTVNIMMHIMRGNIADPRTINPKISPELSELCMVALAKDPKDRHASAQIFADQLRNALNKKKLPARSPRTSKRRYWPALVAGGIIAAGTGGYFLSSYDERRAHRQQLYEHQKSSQTPSSPLSSGRPAVVTPTSIPSLPGPEPVAEVVEDLDTLIRHIDRAFADKRFDELLRLSNIMIRNYPNFYRGYLYRATANVEFFQQTSVNKERVQYRQQVVTDFDRAIELCENTREKDRLRQLKLQFLNMTR